MPEYETTRRYHSGVIPGHRERRRRARTPAHRRAALGIVGQFHAHRFLHGGQHLRLDELGKLRRHRVVFESALVALRVAAAVLDHDRDQRRHAFLRDEIVERVHQHGVGLAGPGPVVASR
ncbi:MAG: hypothetical protein WDM96_13300 [Lacunisphaera sp.]